MATKDTRHPPQDKLDEMKADTGLITKRERSSLTGFPWLSQQVLFMIFAAAVTTPHAPGTQVAQTETTQRASKELNNALQFAEQTTARESQSEAQRPTQPPHAPARPWGTSPHLLKSPAACAAARAAAAATEGAAAATASGAHQSWGPRRGSARPTSHSPRR